MGEQKTVVLALIVAFLFSSLAITQLADMATANPVVPEYLPVITIRDDGSIDPETEFLTRAGNVYALTSDLIEEYTFVIECSDTVFDGAGYSINCSEGGYGNVGLKIIDVTNVTVNNVEVATSNFNSIWLYNCSNCEILNVKTNKDVTLVYGNSNRIEGSNISVYLSSANDNLIVRNNITTILIDSYSQSNNFQYNNFDENPMGEVVAGSWQGTNSWDNGEEGNYWSDYNGADPDGDGIGNTPYILNEHNQDNYPLINPVDTAEIPEFPSWTILLLLSTATLAAIIYKKRLTKKPHTNIFGD
jgi:hypothetical protein